MNIMTSVFWVHKAELLVAFTDRGDTVTAERHIRTPRTLRHVICRKAPTLLLQGAITLHDKARPHTANQTCDWLWLYCWDGRELPPYIPDLIPGISTKSKCSFGNSLASKTCTAEAGETGMRKSEKTLVPMNLLTF
jgi:hypothetical protein